MWHVVAINSMSTNIAAVEEQINSTHRRILHHQQEKVGSTAEQSRVWAFE